MILSKDQAIELVRQQLDAKSDDDKKRYDRRPEETGGYRGWAWHYGRCELAVLLSRIYGVEIKPGDLR